MEHLLSRRAAGATSSVIRDLLRLVDRPGVLSLAGGLPAPEGFPVDRIRLAAERALAGGGRYGVLLWVAPCDVRRAAKLLGAR